MPESDTSSGASGRGRWLLVALAVLTAALGISVALAPVRAEQPVVSWPVAGQPVRSTVLPLVPYRPLSLEAIVGCAVLRELATRPAGRSPGTALRTVPPDAPGAGSGAAQGLRVSAQHGRVVVRSSGVIVLAEPVPPGECRYQVVSDAAGVRVRRNGALVAERPGLPPPQVAELATDATGTAELAVRLRPDDRYASAPTALKTALLIAHLLALAATLVLAVRVWPGRRPSNRPTLVVPRPSGADAVVVVVSAAWALLGPLNWDDAWYLLMARNAGETGYVGNYIYMFNAAEAPFVASQYLLQAWGWAGGWGLAWMRLLPLAYGLATWGLLRILLATALGRTGTLPRVAWLLLVAHLLWWLPYGMMLRPEPLIVLCTAGVLVLVEVARRRRSLGVLVVAIALAAVTLTVSPTGAVAWAPLVTTLPWLVPLLRQAGAGPATAVAGAAVSIVAPVSFADASLGEVLDATATHTWYYLTHSWYEEILHYTALLTLSDTGVWGRRAPVLLTLAVLVLVAIGCGRRRGAGDPLHRLLAASALTTAVALALLALSPTKWVNHFGALGAAGAVLLTAALLRSPLPRGAGRVRAGPVATGTAVLTVALAAAAVYAGPNLWRPFSDSGQPFGDHLRAAGTPYEISLMAPHAGPLYLRNPLVWVGAAGVLAAAIALWRRRGRRTGLDTDRALLLAACGFSVALLLAVFAVAPLRQHPGWTVAAANLRALTGQPCGLAEAVQVLSATGPQPVADGPAHTSGDFALAGGAPGPLQPPAEDTPIWHDAVPATHTEQARERGALSTPWFALPADSPATHVSIPVAGGALAGQQVRVQLGRISSVRGDRVPLPVQTVPLHPDPRARLNTWQEIGIPREGADAVRVLVRDNVTGPDSWLAVAAPSLTSWQPARAGLAGRPVFADQLSAVLWPCADQVAIRRGIAEPPAVRLLADDGIDEFVLNNPLDPHWGGAFVTASYTSTYVSMATRLHPAGPPTRPWGRVQRVRYDHPAGLVDLHLVTVVEPGWHRDPPLTSEAYSGRQYLGYAP